MEIKYNIEKGQLFADVDCEYDKENNKIDVYGTMYWTADDEEEYKAKEKIINDYIFENDLVKIYAWCDISGYDYWVIQQEEENYVSIDVILKKPVGEYTQNEIRQISDWIGIADDYFIMEL